MSFKRFIFVYYREKAMRYKVGFPGWKIAYKMGVPLYYRYTIYFNPELKHFCGFCPDIKGAITESSDLKEVIEAIQDCALEFISVDLNSNKINLKPCGELKDYFA